MAKLLEKPLVTKRRSSGYIPLKSRASYSPRQSSRQSPRTVIAADFLEFSFQPISQSNAYAIVDETMELLREQLEDDSDIEDESYLF